MVAQTGSALKKLTETERNAVSDFLARVHSAYGSKIQRAMLFGSKARGEAASDSDIDILLVATEETWKFMDEICKFSADVSLQYDVLLDARVVGVKRWRDMSESRAGLYRNISRDGIPLAI
jgi:predicted nucleotidyltransferase